MLFSDKPIYLQPIISNANPMPRSPAEEIKLEARRMKASQLYLRGTTKLSQIARELGVDKSQISRDFKCIKAEWQKRYAQDLNTAKAEELSRIEDLLLEYWTAWHRSQENKETRQSEQSDTEGGSRKKASIKTEGKEGNPAFLQGVERCSEQRRKLLGLDAPITYRDVTELTDEELLRIVAASTQGASDRGIGAEQEEDS